jgi:hypothetical protein
MSSLKRMLAALIVGCAVSLTALADENCVLPPAPGKTPEGSKASEAEMTTAIQTLKEYNADVETYLKCLEFQMRQNHLREDDERKMHNIAVDQLQRVADKLNEQVRKYNAFKNKSG